MRNAGLYGWYRKLEKPVQESFVQVQNNAKSILIAQALQLSRKYNIRPPYFVSMQFSDVKEYIDSLNSRKI